MHNITKVTISEPGYPTYEFEVVDHAPDGYAIWNIGGHGPEGYVPLYEQGESKFEVNVSTLKAVPCERWRKVTNCASYARTYGEAREFLWDNRGAEEGTWQARGCRLLRECIDDLRRIFTKPIRWTIHEIEALTYYDMLLMDGEWLEVKGHDVLLTDLGEPFGYSALVCADGHHIKYANDYELHHRSKSRGELREWYVTSLNAKLFTEDELVQPSDDYDERQAKARFIVNYYSYRRECYHLIGKKPDWYDEGVTCCPGCYIMYRSEDRDFAQHIQDLYRAFRAANDPLRDYEHAYKAFLYEMHNHEYAINWQGDWDVIRCFANVDGNDAEDMLPKTGWSDEVKRAYREAARKAMSVEY